VLSITSRSRRFSLQNAKVYCFFEAALQNDLKEQKSMKWKNDFVFPLTPKGNKNNFMEIKMATTKPRFK